MQNDNLTPQQQNTPTPEGQKPANIQPPSVASVGERVIQSLSSDLTPESRPAPQPVVSPVSGPSSTVAIIYSTASADAAPANDNDGSVQAMVNS